MGQALHLVKPFVQELPCMIYSHAWQLLRKRYEDPHVILSAYRKEVMNSPKLKFGNTKDFRLTISLENMRVWQMNIVGMQSLHQISFIVWGQSYPNDLTDSCNRTAYNIRKMQEYRLSPSDLIEFLYQSKPKTTLVKEALQSYIGKSEKYKRYKGY